MTNHDPRLDEMKAKLAAIKQVETQQTKTHEIQSNDQENSRVGLRAGAELITSIIAGGFIGYMIDKNFETKPVFLIAFLLLGVITGFVNVWRTTQGIGYQVGYRDEMKQDNKEREKRG